MKKLTRYTDFDTLKLDVKPGKTNLNLTDRYLHELEDFLKLLRSKFYAGKKANNQKFPDGQ